MEDDDGNLLVVDHPMINEFYEYALKKRILENMIMDGNPAVANQFQLVSAELRGARNNALSIVNTPNFSEMQKVWAMNRKAMYSKYYDMFKSYSHPTQFNINNAV
jgi:predicted phosphatase